MVTRLKRRSKKSVPGETKALPTAITLPLICMACVAGYYPILATGFLCDDYLFIHLIDNWSINLLGAGNLYFRPLAVLTFAFDWHVVGN